MILNGKHAEYHNGCRMKCARFGMSDFTWHVHAKRLPMIRRRNQWNDGDM